MFDYIFWRSDHTHLTECSHQWFSYRQKNLKNEHFKAIILKQKRTSAAKVMCIFWMTLLGSKVHLNYIFPRSVCTRFTEITTDGSFRDKAILRISIFDAIIVTQKRRIATKAIYVFQRILECPYIVQLHISESRWTSFIKSSRQRVF